MSAVIFCTNGFKLSDDERWAPEGRMPTRMYMTVHPVSELGEQFSKTTEVLGIKWRILAAKQGEYFAVFLYADEGDIGDKSLKVNCSFRLNSSGVKQPKRKPFADITFNKNNLNWGFSNFMKWDELIRRENGHVVYDTAYLEVDLDVEEIKTENL